MSAHRPMPRSRAGLILFRQELSLDEHWNHSAGIQRELLMIDDAERARNLTRMRSY